MRKNTFIAFIFNCCFSFSLTVFASYQSFAAAEISFERDSRLPIVYVNAVFKAGAVTDPEEKAGLTNFMGEMLLRGTRSRTKEQIDLALDQMGANLEVDTRPETLIFRGAVLSSQLDAFLNLLREILTQPSFSEKEIKKLKSEIVSVIQEELGHDGSLSSLKFNQFLFRHHPYGKSILGKTSDIQRLSASDIIAHYHRLIRESNILVIGTGDTYESKIQAWVSELTQNFPKTQLTSEDEKILSAVSTPSDNERRRLLIVDKPDRTQTQIYAGHVGLRMTDKDFFPLYLGNHAFGGHSFSAILMTEIRVKRGWSYGASSTFRHALQPRSWSLHLFPAEKDTAAALAYSLKLVDEIKTKGLTEEQFTFAKQSLVNSAGFMYNTPKKRIENILLEKTLNLPNGFIQSFGSQIQKVTLSEVNSALKNFLKPEKFAITVLGTAKNLKEGLAKAAGVSLEDLEIKPYTEE